MCRIVGLLDFNNNIFKNEEILLKMRDVMTKGGPDSCGLYIDGRIGMAHRRLSIIDLSDLGNQPMHWDKWTIVFNGEIYNYKEIKNDLLNLGYNFISNTDTEVIIKAYHHWGVDSISRFTGMFSFALYNNQSQKLTLCRDRLGVKPLYWYLHNGIFLFSSEIKAMHQHPNFNKSLDLSTIPNFLQKGFFDSEQCIYKYVYKLKPGTILEIDNQKKINIINYWNVENLFYKSTIEKSDENELINELESLLIRSFDLRMVSDVNVGIFLSGGIDSSLVASILQNRNNKKIDTFTLGFENKIYNEAEISSSIAKIIGTNHHTLYCNEQDFIDVIPILSDIYDEPFGDSASIPTYLISKFSSQKVKVILSGDGGDELFGGYAKYKYALQSRILFNSPDLLKKIFYKLSFVIKPSYLKIIENKFKSYSQISNKYHKFQNTLLSKNINDYIDRSSSFANNHIISKLTNNFQHSKILIDDFPIDRLITYLGVKDMLNYLPNDILLKVDRASMYNSQEAREPFLDQNLINFTLKISDDFKIAKTGQSKYLLKKVLSRYLDPALTEKPKQGFTIPIENWLKNKLKSQILNIKNDFSFFETFNLNRDYFIQITNSFYNNKQDFNPHLIWFVFCLYNWYLRWVD